MIERGFGFAAFLVDDDVAGLVERNDEDLFCVEVHQAFAGACVVVAKALATS